MPKIRATAEVRKLLVELDGHLQKFHSQTATLANRETPDEMATEVGGDRKYTERAILGCAWRINKASKGETS